MRITAQPGRDVVITGLDELSVFAPGDAAQQYRQQHHPIWGLLGQTLQIAAPIYLGGQAAIGLADVVGRRVGDVARDVTVVEQPPYNDPIIVQPPPYNDPIIVQPPHSPVGD